MEQSLIEAFGQIKLFSGNANPELSVNISEYLNISLIRLVRLPILIVHVEHFTNVRPIDMI